MATFRASVGHHHPDAAGQHETVGSGSRAGGVRGGLEPGYLRRRSWMLPAPIPARRATRPATSRAMRGLSRPTSRRRLGVALDNLRTLLASADGKKFEDIAQ